MNKDIVYLITDGSAFKIGKSTSKALNGRISSIQVANPKPITIECLAEVEDGYRAETFLHTKYRHNRSRGKWFEFSQEEIADIKITFSELGQILPLPEPVMGKCLSQEEISTLWESSAEYLINECEINSYSPKWVFGRLETLKASLSAWQKYGEWRGYKPGWAHIQYGKQDATLPPPRLKKRLRGISRTRVEMEREIERKEIRQQRKLAANAELAAKREARRRLIAPNAEGRLVVNPPKGNP